MLSSAKPFRCRALTVAGPFAAALFVALPSFGSGAIDIAAARGLPLGTVVTVEGSVTVPSGAFSSSTFGEGFAIQDHTGGIFVSLAADHGLSYQFGDYEVDPRFQRDIRRRHD